MKTLKGLLIAVVMVGSALISSNAQAALSAEAECRSAVRMYDIAKGWESATGQDFGSGAYAELIWYYCF